MGDAQAYVRTASFNADVAAFFTKWIDDVEESQRSFGAYPDYAPYPMAHGGAGKTFGSGWTDAGIICPWTIWKTYGEHYVIIGLTVSCSLIGVVLFGTIAGSMLPFLLRRLGLDPASASAPFVATLVDVSGLVIYFTIASIFMRGTLL